jgi:hypothetical protein
MFASQTVFAFCSLCISVSNFIYKQIRRLDWFEIVILTSDNHAINVQIELNKIDWLRNMSFPNISLKNVK